MCEAIVNHPSQIPSSSPIDFVKLKNGGIHLGVGYQKLNEENKADTSLLHWVEDS